MSTIYDFKDGRDKYTGFIVLNNKAMLLVSEIRECVQNGFIAFVKGDVAYKAISKKNVIYKATKLREISPLPLPLPKKDLNVHNLIVSIAQNQKLALIHYKKSEIFLGAIVEVRSDHFWGRFFSTNGKFLEPEKINFSSIAKIVWDDTYCSTMTEIAHGAV